jgi:small GTP-binding protein
VKLQIWDTAGAEKYYGMVKMYYAGASACLLVFDPKQPDALMVPEMWITKINEEEPGSIVFALACTKCDTPGERREVSEAEIEQFMHKHSIDIFVETSAKNNYNIDELFQEIVETIISRFDVK